MSSSEQKNKTRDLSVLKVKKEKAALEKEMRKQKEEFEREKKIIQARSQTSIASLESEAEAKIGEANVRFDKEKKRILSFVVSQLGSYSVSATSIDENTMKNCVFNAREKLEKLSKTDEAIRRMIHADDDQNTDEAVAQLMLQN